MFINELEIHNICGCKHAFLKFPSDAEKVPLYIVHSNQTCEIVALALQLICGIKYRNYEALYEIHNKISNAKIKLTFALLRSTLEPSFVQESPQLEHSSDSDVPSTSQQARARLERRKKRRQKIKENEKMATIVACRDFTLNPNVIAYRVDGGPTVECSVLVFQVRFFSCIDVIFPRLTNISLGEYCNGKWLDLINTEFIDKKPDGDDLVGKFCHLYAQRKISNIDFISELTLSVLKARNFLDGCRISHLINIFNDIRWMFEFITCSEYTVWFLLPSVYGKLEDISKISVDNTNFDMMKTEIQIRLPNAKPFDWTLAEKHIQELLLVTVQLSFGYHCQQNIIYLHSLENVSQHDLITACFRISRRKSKKKKRVSWARPLFYKEIFLICILLFQLKKHQDFEYLNYVLLQSSSDQQFFAKNYLIRIVFLCAGLNMCCVLEYCGCLISYPTKGYIIECFWLESTNEWKISTRDRLSKRTFRITSNDFLKHLEENIK